MTRTCTVCTHPDRYEIDGILATRSMSYRDIARQHAVSKDAVSRHVSGGHLAELISRAHDAEERAQADALLGRIEDLQRRTLCILEKAETEEHLKTALMAIAQARRNLELIGEVSEQLDRRAVTNIHLNPQWIELRTVLLGALEEHPHARQSVLSALEGASNGNAGRGALSERFWGDLVAALHEQAEADRKKDLDAYFHHLENHEREQASLAPHPYGEFDAHTDRSFVESTYPALIDDPGWQSEDAQVWLVQERLDAVERLNLWKERDGREYAAC